jgi:hypothetical protein
MPAATSRSAMSLSSTSTLGTKRTPCAWARSASWRAYGAFLSVAVETSEATGMP